MLLDNARDAAQVRPLLPGSPGCAVLVTSRNRPGLVAAEGTHPLTVHLLRAEDARELLVRRAGRHRVAAEPDAVDEIIGRCARLRSRSWTNWVTLRPPRSAPARSLASTR